MKTGSEPFSEMHILNDISSDIIAGRKTPNDGSL
jgi:hypothetical protein